MHASRADIAFLVRSAHRVAVLELLADHPRTRDELKEATGASSPTLGRVLADLEERRWLVAEGKQYALTPLGTFVSERLTGFCDALATERALRDVAQWLPHDIDGFDIALFTDVVISHPGPGYPYEPVERFTQLLAASETMRGFGMAILKSSNLEAFFECVLGDLDCEYIYPPAVFDAVLDWNPQTVTTAVARPNYRVLLHDALPVDEWCGVCLLDDRVSICCYDPETGHLQALVDTGSDAMRTWAETTYERYRTDARPLDAAAVDTPRSRA